MKYPTRLSDAVHILAFVALHPDCNLTSDKLAESVQTNPAYVRQLMSALRKGGLLNSVKGHSRLALSRGADKITLLDVYRAVEGDKPLLHQDAHTNPACGVGVNIQLVLGDFYLDIQEAAEKRMREITLADVLEQYEARVNMGNTLLQEGGGHMKIQQIRNATLKIEYGPFTILLDPWLQDKGTGPSFRTVRPEMAGVKSPMNDLPMPPEKILSGVDFCLVTHLHPDHFTPDYLPQDIPVLVQNEEDKEAVTKMGFYRVTAFEGPEIQMGGITITKVLARHGDNPMALSFMGEGSGYILQGEDKTLYLAGDTVYFDGVAETIVSYPPDVIVLNCCAATTPIGRLIMDLADVEAVCRVAPKATIVATHLDSVNHALLSSDDVRAFAAQKKPHQIQVPANGAWVTLP